MLTTAALIIVLSVFNGFEKLVISLFNSFNPELVIEPSTGKNIHMSEFPLDQLQQIPGIKYVCPILEENALLKYKDRQAIVKLKGVDSTFAIMSQMDTLMVQGQFKLAENRSNYLVLGYGVAYRLQSRLSDFYSSIQVYVPDKSKKASAKLEDSFKTLSLFPSGYFSVRQDYDEHYAFISFQALQDILGQKNVCSSYEVSTTDESDYNEVQKEIKKLLGEGFVVKNRLEQQSVLLQVMQSEKAMVYLILGFILLIATFNIIGSISMLIVDKKPDMETLRAMGASKKLILRIFAIEGMMISLAGGFIGLIIGGLIALIQQQFGVISLGDGGTGFVVDAYPVRIILSDFFKVLIMVILMSSLAVVYPLRQLSRNLNS